MENTLFTKAAYDDLKSSAFIEDVERIVIDKYLVVDGERFDVNDLWETLSEISSFCNIAITDTKMANMLKKYGVISYEGSMRNCMPAEPGPNFKDFMNTILKDV